MALSSPLLEPLAPILADFGQLVCGLKINMEVPDWPKSGKMNAQVSQELSLGSTILLRMPKILKMSADGVQKRPTLKQKAKETVPHSVPKGQECASMGGLPLR